PSSRHLDQRELELVAGHEPGQVLLVELLKPGRGVHEPAEKGLEPVAGAELDRGAEVEPDALQSQPGSVPVGWHAPREDGVLAHAPERPALVDDRLAHFAPSVAATLSRTARVAAPNAAGGCWRKAASVQRAAWRLLLPRSRTAAVTSWRASVLRSSVPSRPFASGKRRTNCSSRLARARARLPEKRTLVRLPAWRR